MYKASY